VAHDRPTRRRGVLPLVLAAALVVVAVTAVWLVAQRDRTVTADADATSSPATSSPGMSSADPGAIDAPAAGALTFEALMTPADIARTGLTVEDPVAIDAPAFPVLCDARDWGMQWSAPQQGVGHDYPGPGAGVCVTPGGSAAAAAASAALARLTDDAASCPTPATGGSVEHSGALAGTGDESAVFLADDGGRDGVIGVTWIVVVRSGSTLLQVAYTTEERIGTGSGPADGDDAGGAGPVARSTAESLARAALDRFAAQA
jgi:hypothetical protein